ncbi:MAG: non-homologous end-joining DNA ligase, partial [Balneolaceae bacterium]
LVVPLEPDAGMSEVFEAAKAIAQPFVRKHGDETTLQIKKNARKGRILIDIYRNRTRQTIIAPYSLRGVPGAPVSMPLNWEELETLPDSAHYHLRNAEEKIQSEGDAWEGIGGYASVLHTRRTAGEQTHVTPGSPYHKSPAQLAEYGKKRDFTKTPEPGSARQTDRGNNFVIHRHHATRLHYDLRIEQDGVLRSWAVPKGLPHRPGVKRLAIQTEDHPVEYLDFEGSIPKQEYGGGDMWIFARGKYTLTKEKKNGLYFRLESSALSGEYRMHKTSENQWLMEKTDQPQKDWLNDPVSPMNGNTTAAPPEGDYIYEIKWDGIRALFSLEDGRLRIHSRNRNDITEKFPELTEAAGSFRATCGLFDGEIVVLDETGKPDFQKVINRLKSSGSSAIQKMSRRNPVHCYIFDCLYLDGRSLVADPLARRQEWLADVIKKEMPFRLSETVDDGEALFEAAKKHHLEGIMAKKKDGRYLAGKRSDLWLKVKVRRTVDCHVIGYTKGKGSRDFYFGALHLAEKKEGAMKYRGKVGTGFNEQSMQQVYEELARLETAGKPDLEHIPDDAETVWVKPELIVEVNYARLSDNGLFKEAVFIKMRTDLIL